MAQFQVQLSVHKPIRQLVLHFSVALLLATKSFQTSTQVNSMFRMCLFSHVNLASGSLSLFVVE